MELVYEFQVLWYCTIYDAFMQNLKIQKSTDYAKIYKA